MDDEILAVLKRMENELIQTRDEIRLILRRINDIEKKIEVVNDVFEDVENVREEINRYFELRNTPE